MDGREHPHAFCGKTRETRTSTVMHSRRGLRVESGLDELFLLKSTDSAFCGFLRDRYTTLRRRLRSDPGHDAQGRLALQ